MKRVPLTQNKFSLVSNVDFKKVSQHKWYAIFDNYNWYAGYMSDRFRGRRRTIKMHTFLMNPPKGMEIDHKDGDGLNNQRKNLRICTHQQNTMNRSKRLDNTSGFKGVHWNKNDKKWVARIQVEGERKLLGYFTSKENAALAYIKACQKYHGKYSKIS